MSPTRILIQVRYLGLENQELLIMNNQQELMGITRKTNDE